MRSIPSANCLRAATAVVIALIVSLPADAAFRGDKGRIAFSRDGDLFSMQPDGTDLRVITDTPHDDRWPRWSPDGAHLAFVRDGDLYLLRYVNGVPEPLVRLTGHGEVVGAASWHPDGTRLAYAQRDQGIRSVNENGVDDQLLIAAPALTPAWSPRGDWIAYSDGTSLYRSNLVAAAVRLTIGSLQASDQPAWCADGERILYRSTDTATGATGIAYVFPFQPAAGGGFTGGGLFYGTDSEPACRPDAVPHSVTSSPAGMVITRRNSQGGTDLAVGPLPNGANGTDEWFRLLTGSSTSRNGEADWQPKLAWDTRVLETNTTTAAAVRVSIPASVPRPAVLNWYLSALSASAHLDYVEAAGAVTAGADDHELVIPVSIIGDAEVEGEETFSLTVLFPGFDAIATITIVDDDPRSRGPIASDVAPDRSALYSHPDMFAGSVAIQQDAEHVAISPDGSRIAYRSRESGAYEIWVADTMSPFGTLRRLTSVAPGSAASRPAWSPDGSTIAFVIDNATIWLMDADGANPRALIAGDHPTWSPDGQRLAFSRGHASIDCLACASSLHVVDATGLNEQKLVGYPATPADPIEHQVFPSWDPDWSPDGRYLVYTGQHFISFDAGYSEPRIMRLDLESPIHPGSPLGPEPANPRPLVDPLGSGAARCQSPAWSPDGALVIYSCRETARPDALTPLDTLWVADRDGFAVTPTHLAGISSDWGSWPSSTQGAVQLDRPLAVAITEGDEDRTLTVPITLSFFNGAAPVPVELSWQISPRNATEDVDYTPAGGVLTFRPGEATVPLSVVIRGDDDAEANESFVVCFSADAGIGSCQWSTEVTIRDDDSGNRAPLTGNDVALTALDTPVAIDVLSNDSDPDGAPLTLVSPGTPQHGSVIAAGGVITYTPDAGYTGLDQFLYSVSDGEITSQGAVRVYVGEFDTLPPALLTVTPPFLDFGVVPLNKTRDLVVTVTNNTAAPVAIFENWPVAQDEPYPFDVELEGCARVPVLGPGQSCERRVRFWAGPGADGATPALIELLNRDTIQPAATIPLFAAVGPPDSGPNTAPVPVDDVAGVAPGFTHNLDALRNDTDPENDLLRLTAVADPPHGTARIIPCAPLHRMTAFSDCIEYQNDPGFTGIDTVVYTVSDGRGGEATATYHIAVGNVVPVVSSITPDRGPVGGGQTVRITGSNFLHLSQASLICNGGIVVLPLDMIGRTNEEIVAVTPPHVPGACNVQVRTVFAQVGALANGYTYEDADPSPVVSIADASALEGAAVRFTISLSTAAATDVTVTAATADGSAVSPDDYTARSAEVVIPAGQTSITFDVATVDDSVNETSETFTVTLSAAAGASVGDGIATGTITDRPRLTLSAVAPALEGNILQFALRLDRPSAGDISIRLATQDGTAAAPDDYTAHASTTILLPAGQTEAFFDVATRDDSLVEGDETVVARILGGTGVVTVVNLTATGTIVDDTPRLTLAAVAPAFEGEILQFALRLDRPGSSTISIRLETGDGTAEAPGDYTAQANTTVTFTAGQTEAFFEVVTRDDSAAEGDETVVARILGGSGLVSVVNLSATGTIIDDTPRLTMAAVAPAVEGETLRFALQLDRPVAGTITIRLATEDGTAQAPADYVAQTNTTVTFAPGQVAAFFDVATLDDLIMEGDETVRARILGGTGFVSVVNLSAVGTIVNQTIIATSTTLTSSRNPSLTTAPPIFTATVTAASPSIAGLVEFRSNGVLIGTSRVFQRGGQFVAVLGGSMLGTAAGPHAITARYLGNGPHQPSDSAVLDQTVRPGTFFSEVVSAAPPGFAPVALNDNGRIAGNRTNASGTVSRAGVYDPLSGFRNVFSEVEFSHAGDLNAAGVVVGRGGSDATDTVGFLDRDGTIETIDNSRSAAGINFGEQIAVNRFDGLAAIREGASFSTLDQFDARAINDAADVAGSIVDGFGQPSAMLWQDGAIHELGRFGGSSAAATHVTNDGSVLVQIGAPSGDVLPLLWRNGVETPLGFTRAWDINDAGVVVGGTSDAGVYLGGSWTTLAFGTVRGMAINNHGQIAGSVANQLRLWTPVPTSTLVVSPVSGFADDDTTVTATLTSNGAPMAGYTIAFSFNGRAVGSAITGADGVAVLAEASLCCVAIGTYPDGVRATFAGNRTLGESAATAPLTIEAVNPADVRATVTGQPAYTVGSNATFNVTLANLGPSSAQVLRLNVTLPAGLQFISDNGAGACSWLPGLGTCDFDNVPAGATRTVAIVARPLSSAAMIVSFAASAPQHDPNPANNTALLVVDPRPTVTIDQAAGQSDPSTVSPIAFTVVFSEPVSGFTASDVSFAGSSIGGTLAASISGGGTTYTVSVTGMAGIGTVAVSIPAGAAVDGGGNPSAASTSSDRTVLYGLATVVAFVSPANGGNAALTLLNTAGRLTGIFFYNRGSVLVTATRFTSFVIDGQTAIVEGFTTTNRFFSIRTRDGGSSGDNFQLWLDNVEQTAQNGALSSGTVLVQPWAADTRLRGWVDLHTHPMSNLAFGGKLFHGAPSAGSLMPAVQMPSDPQCRFDVRATNIAEALSQDGPTRGDAVQSRCGDFTRNLLIRTIESVNGAVTAPAASDGYPNFTYWPKWNDITHQKMWVDWIRRAWDGGQRVMVALSHNNRTLADALGGGGPISGVRTDRASSDLQIEEIKQLVAAHSDFMEVATTPADLHAIVRSGRLAVVLGVEIDKIGDFSATVAPSEAAIDAEVARLYAQGVRYILPVHFVDNAFGDAAVDEPLFNIINYRENQRFFSMGCAQFADEIGFRFPGLPPILAPFMLPGMPALTVPACMSGATFLGHINTRSSNGLTARGEYAIRAMMRRGIIVDIDHMSNRAANRTLAIANSIPDGGYPLTSGHSALRERTSSQFNSEIARSSTQLARIACLGGMFGLGTDGAGGHRWAAQYERAYSVMRRAFAPNGLCPSALPLGAGFVALGTDANSLVRTPVPPMLDPVGPVRFADIYNPAHPLNAGAPALGRSTTGNRTWDYNFDGVAHYGMFVDFLRDVRMWNPLPPAMNGRQIVDDQMMYGADYFYRMWQKADTQKTRVP